jgi:hypothetical protein
VRICSTGVCKGAHVELNHVPHDKDIVELHFGRFELQFSVA